jgi:hypothetical protein
MKVRQIKDIAGFFADLDSIDPEDWSLSFDNYQKLIAEGKFDPYGNMFDTGYERLAFIFALFHEFENRFLAQSDYMDAIDHPNADEVFAFEMYEDLRKGALVRMFGSDVNVDQWDFFE